MDLSTLTYRSSRGNPRVSGVKVKMLWRDSSGEAYTALFRMDPGAVSQPTVIQQSNRPSSWKAHWWTRKGFAAPVMSSGDILDRPTLPTVQRVV